MPLTKENDMGEIVLVRHGQASFDAENYDQLSEVGELQSRVLGKYFVDRAVFFNNAICGDMVRHAETLNTILDSSTVLRKASRSIHSGLNEYDFRTLVSCFIESEPNNTKVIDHLADRSDKTKFYRLLRDVLNSWSKDGIEGIDETWANFMDRVAMARVALENMATKGKRVLVVASGGSISCLVGQVLELSPGQMFELNLQIYNTSLSRLFVGSSRISLASFNEIPHLADPDLVELATYG